MIGSRVLARMCQWLGARQPAGKVPYLERSDLYDISLKGGITPTSLMSFPIALHVVALLMGYISSGIRNFEIEKLKRDNLRKEPNYYS